MGIVPIFLAVLGFKIWTESKMAVGSVNGTVAPRVSKGPSMRETTKAERKILDEKTTVRRSPSSTIPIINPYKKRAKSLNVRRY